MNQQELATILAVIDASMNKGGVIAPDAMYLVCEVRQKVVGLIEQLKQSKPEPPKKDK